MSYLAHVASTAGYPALRAALAEEQGAYWICPEQGHSFQVTSPIVSDVRQQPSVDPRSGEVTIRERCDMTVSRAELAEHGVDGPAYELKVQIPTGAWIVDLAESVWGETTVKLALARRPLARMQEMRRADV